MKHSENMETGKESSETIFEYLAQMNSFVMRQDWDGLESFSQSLARTLAGEDRSNAIASLSFLDYERNLSFCLNNALQEGRRIRAGAIYFEFDLENDWQGFFFLCRRYKPEAMGDDDWASDYAEVVQGPDFPEQSSIYKPGGFDKTNQAKGVTLYLIARTIASFGRAAEALGPWEIPVCAAFHDQDPIFRICAPKL